MKIMLSFCFALLLGCLANPAAAETPPRPNILYFYVDDMGWGSIGPNGQAQRSQAGMASVKTPNLDELARQGVNFVRGYGCHVCSPARSSQQTGFHQGHTFADRNDPNNAKKAMRKDDRCIGELLAGGGYVTGYWGKWGYGGSKDMARPTIDNVQTLPTSHGYQHVLAELHHVRAHTFFQPTLWHAPAPESLDGGLKLVPNSMAKYQGNASYPNQPAMQNDAGYPKTAYCDDAYAMAALDFVRQQATEYNRTGKPFFGLLAAQIPHAPFGEIARLPHWDQAYANDPFYTSLSKTSQQWAAMVTRIDAHMGNILAILEDPNQDGDPSDSISDNTLVVFQSDNGGPSGASIKELGANGPLRGTKGSIFEGGIRVPLIMRWPAAITSQSKLAAGENTDMVVDVTDLLPTFCELAGVEPPVGIDGVSIAPTLRGQRQQRKREFLIHEAGNGQSIIRGNHKLIQTKKGNPQLYDLNTDPSESDDISSRHPKLVKQLQSLLIGERVDEPRGFANTYHHWTGVDNASLSDENNWSDYRYENAGVTYQEDDGAPQVSWIARLKNDTKILNRAIADENLSFLALEIAGDSGSKSVQTLKLRRDVTLIGRNEIRVRSHGSLELDHATLSSLRWVDIGPTASLGGSGTVDATVYNRGTIKVDTHLQVNGDIHLAGEGVLAVTRGNVPIAITVSGTAHLDGELKLKLNAPEKPSPGTEFPLIQADQIRGRFSSAEDSLISSEGFPFSLRYDNDAVVVIIK